MTDGQTDDRSEALSAFAAYIRELRRQRGLTQEQLAQRSGLAVEMIARVERGDYSPALSTLGKLCVGFEIPMSRLFEGLERAQREGSKGGEGGEGGA